jgi:pimeloyl-ACP methyl ester carboxylesterase
MLVARNAQAPVVHPSANVSISAQVIGNVHGVALDCGHFLAEERPAEVTATLHQFLAR